MTKIIFFDGVVYGNWRLWEFLLKFSDHWRGCNVFCCNCHAGCHYGCGKKKRSAIDRFVTESTARKMMRGKSVHNQNFCTPLQYWIREHACLLLFNFFFHLAWTCLLACPRISNMRNIYGTKHFHSHLENEMLKNQKILKIGPRLGVPLSDQSFST